MELRETRGRVVVLVLAAMTVSLAGGAQAQERATGLDFVDPATYRSIPLASTPLMGDLPTSVDLSQRFPVPGDQGVQSSCVGWAVAYALKSYQEAHERQWNLNSPETLFSPAFIYNQIKRSQDCKGGTSYVDALNLLRRDGVATLADFPYSENQCSSIPGEAVKQRAKHFAIADWRRVNVQDETEVKNHLASGFPVLFGMIIDGPFSDLSGPTVYSQFSGENLGGHAMVVVGYDDNRDAFRIINSWGTSWGDGGFGWIGYEAFRQASREGYVVQDIVTVRPDPTPTPNPVDPDPDPDPEPVPTPVPVQPSVSVGQPTIEHNVTVQHPGGLTPGPGMNIRLPGTVTDAQGKTLQLVVRFAFENGTVVMANPQEPSYRDVQGLVATGTPPTPVSSPSMDLGGMVMSIPYYALNIQNTGGQFTYEMTMNATVYLDNFIVAQSEPTSFTVRW